MDYSNENSRFVFNIYDYLKTYDGKFKIIIKKTRFL
jgi:hypothetical protein